MPQENKELLDLWETAMYREIASQAYYEAARGKTDDPGARKILTELALQEAKHYQLLRGYKEKGFTSENPASAKIADLRQSEYLTSDDKIEGAGLQDVMRVALKREEQAIAFYSSLQNIIDNVEAKNLCERLTKEETKHLDILRNVYEDLFHQEG